MMSYYLHRMFVVVTICHFQNCWSFKRSPQSVFGKIIKIVATRCHILRLKCTKFDLRWGSAPDPAGGAYSAPLEPLDALQGPYFLRGGRGVGEWSRRRGEGKGEKKGTGREGVAQGSAHARACIKDSQFLSNRFSY